MTPWQIFGILALVALVLEIFMPAFFFLNFAIAGVITAIISIWITNITHLCIIYLGLSVLSLLLFRPLFIKKYRPENSQTGVEATYFGKIAKVVEPITKTSGVISIYDERWNARLANGEEEIPVGSEVKIIRNDSLTLFVEKA